MKILVTGLCTLHWGRLQFGNIGNYYIIEPLFRQLHRVFPCAEIQTTFQMTEDFINKEKITVLPMDWYYSWKNDDLDKATYEYKTALNEKTNFNKYTPFMKCVQKCQLVINVSGDMWGDNAEHVGHDRFLVDLFKMRTVQLLGVKTVLFAGTPGPFSDNKTINFAKEVGSSFDLIVNREPTSSNNLKKWGFDMKNVKEFACPAFLYQPQLTELETYKIKKMVENIRDGRMLAGFTIGGFNMPVGPYDKWPRDDSEYTVFAEAIEYMINELQIKVILMSHTNGFEKSPQFKLVPGRDYPILHQLLEVLKKRNRLNNINDVYCIKEAYLPKIIKSMIGKLDIMVTGRVHASVAAISQNVPTVFINYEKSFIPSTKMYGFSSLAGIEEYTCEPGNIEQLKLKIKKCKENCVSIRKHLEVRIPEVKNLAALAFDEMEKLL